MVRGPGRVEVVKVGEGVQGDRSDADGGRVIVVTFCEFAVEAKFNFSIKSIRGSMNPTEAKIWPTE